MAKYVCQEVRQLIWVEIKQLQKCERQNGGNDKRVWKWDGEVQHQQGNLEESSKRAELYQVQANTGASWS